MRQREELSEGLPRWPRSEPATSLSSRLVVSAAAHTATAAPPVRAVTRQGVLEICSRGRKVFASRRRRVKLHDRTSVSPVRSRV